MLNAIGPRSLRLSAALTLVGVLLSGCGNSPTEPAASGSSSNTELELTTIKADPTAQALLPPAVKSSEVLRIATALKWPPFAYKNPDSGAAEGLDVELTQAIAYKLGLKPELNDMAFPALIPGVQNGRYDIAANQLEDSPKRRQEVDNIIYARARMGVLTKRGGATISPDDLCGRTLAATQGTSQIQLLTTISDKCVQDGKQAIMQQVLPDSASTILAVSNGRAEGFVMNTATGKYLTDTTQKDLTLQPGTLPVPESRTALVTARGSGMAQAVQAAVQSLIDDGTYKKIFDKYGMSGDMVDKAEFTSAP